MFKKKITIRYIQRQNFNNYHSSAQDIYLKKINFVYIFSLDVYRFYIPGTILQENKNIFIELSIIL